MNKPNWFLKQFRQKRVLTYFILSVAGLIIILPALWIFISSFKSREELIAYPIQFFPKSIQTINYYLMLRYSGVGAPILRTFILGITTAAITCVTSAKAGYAFARIRVPERKKLFSLVIALLIVPNIVLLVPQFILYARYHLINTYWPWYLAAFGATNPLYIFMYRQFFIGFPKELEEAAELDGASPAGIFLNIILPNSRPALATILIFAFSAVWGDFIMPTMFLNNPSQLLGAFVAISPTGQGGSIMDFPFTVVYMLPVIVLFILIQKNIQKGMLFTGLHA